MLTGAACWLPSQVAGRPRRGLCSFQAHRAPACYAPCPQSAAAHTQEHSGAASAAAGGCQRTGHAHTQSALRRCLYRSQRLSLLVPRARQDCTLTLKLPVRTHPARPLAQSCQRTGQHALIAPSRSLSVLLWCGAFVSCRDSTHLNARTSGASGSFVPQPHTPCASAVVSTDLGSHNTQQGRPHIARQLNCLLCTFHDVV